MLKLVARAKEIERISITGMVEVPEYHTKFPPVKSFKAALMNSELDYAGMYAAKAIAFANSGHVKEAEDNMRWAERAFSRYEWARDASLKDIHLYEIEWYRVFRV